MLLIMLDDSDCSNLRVLLLYPNHRSISLVPPSMALFASLLKAKGIKVELFDTSFYKVTDEELDSDRIREKNLTVRAVTDDSLVIPYKYSDVYEDFNQKIEEYRPHLVLTTVTDSTFDFGIQLLRKVRSHNFISVFGGVFPTFASEVAIKYPEIDIVCVGEGEYAIIDLCSRVSKGESYLDIPNLWIKTKGGSIFKNKLRPPTNVDELPPLDFSIFDEKRLYRMMGGKVYKMLPVETHRGCPYMCTYCGSPTQRQFYLDQTNSCFYREKSLEKVKETLHYDVKRWKPGYIFFWADTFLAYTEEKIEEFCRFYSDIQIPFYVQARPETITDYKLKKLKEVGLDRVGVGIEHGNEDYRNKVLKRYYKNSQAVASLEIIRKNGVRFSLNNIIGLPEETPELAMDTVELNRQIKGFDDASCSIFQPYYGTSLRELCVQKGYIKPGLICPHNASGSLLNMPQFPKERIASLARTFILYVRLPKERWNEVKIAESFTPEGNAMFKQLSREVREKFFVPESDL